MPMPSKIFEKFTSFIQDQYHGLRLQADHRPQSIADDETECAMEGLAYSFLEMGGHFQQAERWYHRLIYGMHTKKPSHKKKKSSFLRHSNSAQAGWHTNLGNALFAQGKIDEAVLHFKMSTRIDKSRPFAYDGLGRVPSRKVVARHSYSNQVFSTCSST